MRTYKNNQNTYSVQKRRPRKTFFLVVTQRKRRRPHTAHTNHPAGSVSSTSRCLACPFCPEFLLLLSTGASGRIPVRCDMFLLFFVFHTPVDFQVSAR
jgi:hypothetical protein